MIRKIKVIGLIFICLIITSNNILGADAGAGAGAGAAASSTLLRKMTEAGAIAAVSTAAGKISESIIDFLKGKLSIEALKNILVKIESALRLKDDKAANEVGILRSKINFQTTSDEYYRMANDTINSINARVSELERQALKQDIINKNVQDQIDALKEVTKGQSVAPAPAINQHDVRFKDNGNGTITDYAKDLMWQKSGSPNALNYENANAYVEMLNHEGFAGHSDWRLPTLIELKSLLTQEQQSNGMFINPIFDSTQPWCWTSGKHASGVAWLVYFFLGIVTRYDLGYVGYARAVRSL